MRPGQLAAILLGVMPTESAILVPVPSAESAVSPWRARLDPSAAWGVPAQVTVLYPFLHPERIDDVVLETLAAAVRTVPRFHLELTAIGSFGDSVVWLAPDPNNPFRALTTAVWQRFPETPPFGGQFPDVVPHLTVGNEGPD